MSVTEKREIEVVGVPNAAAEVIRDVYESTGGESMASVLLDRASSPDSPLHRYFTWDDNEAAHAHRITQAEALIRRVKVRVIVSEDEPPIRVRAFVASKDVSGGEVPRGSFTSIQDVSSSPDMEAALLAAITRDLSALRNKYRSCEHLFRAAIEDLLDAAAS